ALTSAALPLPCRFEMIQTTIAIRFPEVARMRRSLFSISLLLLFTTASLAQNATEKAPAFSIENIDKSLNPCVDFYQYACGNWMKTHEIPADRASLASFIEVDEHNLEVLRGILEKASGGGAGRNAIDQKIGDYYGACMDEKAAETKGLDPL